MCSVDIYVSYDNTVLFQAPSSLFKKIIFSQSREKKSIQNCSHLYLFCTGRYFQQYITRQANFKFIIWPQKKSRDHPERLTKS